MTAIATVLSAYPEWVVAKVTHPLNGIPGESDWLPHVSEVKAACEKLIEPIRAQIKREERAAETERLLAAPVAGPIERERAVKRWEEQSAGMRRLARPHHMTEDEAKAKLDDFRAAPPLEQKPLTIGPDLAQKLSAMAQKREDAA